MVVMNIMLFFEDTKMEMMERWCLENLRCIKSSCGDHGACSSSIIKKELGSAVIMAVLSSQLSNTF